MQMTVKSSVVDHRMLIEYNISTNEIVASNRLQLSLNTQVSKTVRSGFFTVAADQGNLHEFAFGGC